ncbi:uncharacterized protein LOC121369499 [Gigantopelta aegis]|uniref:uncharacterized protein LOC121369499 n=1 Tax=Gigantopelta aegis TaxID=1735272 RepID=UPI001B88D388|nr:uncharacterized protein LOC121369499 [Gigantopelta aegis]
MAAYVTIAFIMLLANWDTQTDERFKHPHSVMVYLTTWTYFALTLHMVLTASIAVWCQYQARSRSRTKTNSTNVTLKSFSSDTVYPQNNPAFSDELDNGDVESSTKCENKQINVEKSDLKITDPEDVTSDSTESLHVQEPCFSKNRMPWYLNTSWILWNIVSVNAIVVTAIYFGALYNKLQIERGHPGIDYDNVNVHALNTVFVFADVVVCARPVRLLHVVYPIVYGLVYAIFSILFWSVNHSNVIYKDVLDWNHAGFTTGVLAVVAFFIMPLLQCCYFALYRLRLFISKKIYGEDY